MRDNRKNRMLMVLGVVMIACLAASLTPRPGREHGPYRVVMTRPLSGPSWKPEALMSEEPLLTTVLNRLDAEGYDLLMIKVFDDDWRPDHELNRALIVTRARY